MPDPLQPGSTAPPFSVQPVFGRAVSLPDDLARGPLVLVFVSHLGSPFARLALAELQERFPDLDRMGAQVLAVTPTPLAPARDYVPRHHLLFGLVADPNGELHARYGVGQDTRLLGTLASLPLLASRARRALGRGVGRRHGSTRQLGAALVIDANSAVAWAQYGRSVAEGVDLDGVVQAVGAITP